MPNKLTKWRQGHSELGYGQEGIVLLDGEANRILSVTKQDGEQIQFMEECDGHFRLKCSKQEALQIVDELKAWIKSV